MSCPSDSEQVDSTLSTQSTNNSTDIESMGSENPSISRMYTSGTSFRVKMLVRALMNATSTLQQKTMEETTKLHEEINYKRQNLVTTKQLELQIQKLERENVILQEQNGKLKTDATLALLNNVKCDDAPNEEINNNNISYSTVIEELRETIETLTKARIKLEERIQTENEELRRKHEIDVAELREINNRIEIEKNNSLREHERKTEDYQKQVTMLLRENETYQQEIAHYRTNNQSLESCNLELLANERQHKQTISKLKDELFRKSNEMKERQMSLNQLFGAYDEKRGEFDILKAKNIQLQRENNDLRQQQQHTDELNARLLSFQESIGRLDEKMNEKNKEIALYQEQMRVYENDYERERKEKLSLQASLKQMKDELTHRQMEQVHNTPPRYRARMPSQQGDYSQGDRFPSSNGGLNIN